MKNQTTSLTLKAIVKLILVVATLVIAYLYVLNGRYTKMDYDRCYFDKWTKTMLVIDRERIIE